MDKRHGNHFETPFWEVSGKGQARRPPDLIQEESHRLTSRPVRQGRVEFVRGRRLMAFDMFMVYAGAGSHDGLDHVEENVPAVLPEPRLLSSRCSSWASRRVHCGSHSHTNRANEQSRSASCRPSISMLPSVRAKISPRFALMRRMRRRVFMSDFPVLRSPCARPASGRGYR